LYLHLQLYLPLQLELPDLSPQPLWSKKFCRADIGIPRVRAGTLSLLDGCDGFLYLHLQLNGKRRVVKPRGLALAVLQHPGQKGLHRRTL